MRCNSASQNRSPDGIVKVNSILPAGAPGRGQGGDLLETRGWDDLASGVIEASYSWSSSFLTAAIWRSSNSVERRPRQRSAARMSAPNMSLSTGFSPPALLAEQPFEENCRPDEAPMGDGQAQ